MPKVKEKEGKTMDMLHESDSHIRLIICYFYSTTSWTLIQAKELIPKAAEPKVWGGVAAWQHLIQIGTP